MKNSTTEQNQVAELGEFINNIRFAMLTTKEADGSLRSRPMATQEMDAEGNLWFFTELDSAKSEEIENDAQVSISYADPDDNVYVSVSGIASTFRDAARARQLWNTFVQAWFPNGPEDPNVGLIRVEVEKAEYWKGPTSRAVQVFNMLKASATGKRPDMVDNEKLRIK